MKRWLKRIAALFASIFGLLIALALTMHWLGVRQDRAAARPAKPWREARTNFPASREEFFAITNIWETRLQFETQDWEGIEPSRVEPVRSLFEGGRLALRNPKARRSGLAGAVGFEFNWTTGKVEIAGRVFTNAAVRYRGNGTFLNSQFGPKQSFKLDLNRFAKGQNLLGLDELNLLNSIADDTYLRDSLAEELFRNLGVPGPRSSYAYVTVDVPGLFENQALGLYVVMENIDADFAKDRFGSKKTPIFKPVTYELFHDLGTDWAAYEAIYDLKTEATTAQLRRIVEFAQLVSNADDAEFAAKLAEFLDLEVFAAFVAGHVLLSACDGFLSNGQNFYMYLHPVSNKIGFISWDQDHSFGEFGYIASAGRRERMSIWEPYIYDFKFLRRVMRTESFRTIYQETLERALATHFTERHLFERIDQLAAILRPAVAAESEFRLDRFERAVGEEPSNSRDGVPEGPRSHVRPIKQFIRNRIASVRAQLDGREPGEVLRRGQ